MSPVSALMLATMAALAIYATVSDIRTGIVRNAVIALFFLVAAVLDTVEYIFFSPGLFVPFALNISAAIGLSLVLYCTRTWAGGDLKLSCVMGLLYPAHMYSRWLNGLPTLFFAIVFSLASGWVFAALRSILSSRDRGHTFASEGFARRFSSFLVSYIRVVVIVTAVNGLAVLAFPEDAGAGLPFMPFISFCIAWLANSCKLLKSKWLIAAALLSVAFSTLLLGHLPIAGNLIVYALVLVATALRLAPSPGRYKIVRTESVEEGMILSLTSSALMSTSRVKGLPALSTEGLSSRLTPEEAESVRRWGESAKGAEEVSVVVKTPFAPFICLGYIVYMIVWSIA